MSDVGFNCGITAKDLKVGAQVVHGGCTATNSSMTEVIGCWRRAALRAEKKLLYIKVCKYNKDEKQWQGMETSRLISQVPSLPQPGKITPFGVTLCFAWSEDLTIQKYKCLAKAPDPEFGERSGITICSSCMSLNLAGATCYRASGWRGLRICPNYIYKGLT